MMVAGELTIGSVIVVNIDASLMNLSSIDELSVLYDGVPALFSNINDILAGIGQEPLFCLAIGSDGFQLLLFIPHFSSHSIVLEKKSAIPVTVGGPGSDDFDYSIII